MQRLEVSGAVRPIYGSLGVKLLIPTKCQILMYVMQNWARDSITVILKNMLFKISCFSFLFRDKRGGRGQVD